MNSFSAFLSDDEDAAPRSKTTTSKPKTTTKSSSKPVSKPQPASKPRQKEQNANLDTNPNSKVEKKLPYKSKDKKEYKDERNRGKPKRNFDRKSGTGRGREGKKEGGGAHNWGKETDVDPTTETPSPDTPTPDLIVPEEPKEPEKPTYTLEEYLAKQKEERETYRQGFEQLGSAQVEKVEGKEYTKKYLDEDYFAGVDIERKTKTQKQKEKKEKKTVDGGLLGFAAPSENGGYGGRGGRGRGRGRGGRTFNQQPPKIDSFPALGEK